VIIRDSSKCRVCGRSGVEVPLEVDHIVPVSEGGTDELSNLATLCRDCNRGKSDYHFADYTSIKILPDDLEIHFIFFHDDKTGDFERYHLYCYYQLETSSGLVSENFHREWKITRNDFLQSSAVPKILEDRRLIEEKLKFIEEIRKQLASERKRFIIRDGVLMKV
jgi:hypothetical protein